MIGSGALVWRRNAAQLFDNMTPASSGALGACCSPSPGFSRGRAHRPDGITVGFGYDTAGRPSTVSFDRGTIGFGYHPSTGNLTSLTAPGGNSLGFSYDGSLPTAVSWTGVISGSTAVTYNNNFQVTGQTVNGGNAVSFGGACPERSEGTWMGC